MRKLIPLYVILLTAVITALSPVAAAPASADKSKDLSVVPISAAPSFAKRALIVGIAGYEAASKLSVTTSDAHDFKRMLETKFGFSDNSIILMTDEPSTPDRLKPTYTHLRTEVNTLLASVDENSEVVIFYSGHGARFSDQDWLVPVDGDPEDITGSCISYDGIKQRLETKRPHRALLVVDACRNLREGKDTTPSGFGLSSVSKEAEIAELLSCQPTEVSREGNPADFKQSVFTHFVIQGLEADPEAVAPGTDLVTFDSLKTFVRGKVSQYVATRLGGKQNPDGRASLGSMVLARGAAVSIKPEDVVVSSEDPIAHLKLTVPAGAKVTIDGKGQTGDDLQFDLGADKTREVELVVQLDGYKTKIEKVTLIRGAIAPLSVELEPLSKGAVPTRHSNGLWVGYKEKYVWRINGKEVGSQTADLISVDGGIQSWQFGINMDFPNEGKTVPVRMDGTWRATEMGDPVKMTATVHLLNKKQEVALVFDKTGTRIIGNDGDFGKPRNLVTMLGIPLSILNMGAFRSTDTTNPTIAYVDPESLKIETDSLGPPIKAESIHIGDRTIDCQTFADKQSGGTMLLETTTGALIKLMIPGDQPGSKVEITRE